MLCGSDPAAKALPAGVYEAEESWVDHVDVEANKGRGFLGFGYVSAFTDDKQGFAIDVKVAQAGKYSIAWRYTAGEGTCVRSGARQRSAVDRHPNLCRDAELDRVDDRAIDRRSARRHEHRRAPLRVRQGQQNVARRRRAHDHTDVSAYNATDA